MTYVSIANESTQTPNPSLPMSNNDSRENVLAAILSQENFWPTAPRSLAETGLPISHVESLILKRLSVVGLSSGRQLAKFICLPFELIEDTLRILRERQRVVHKGSAPLNDYTYALTEQGRDRARIEMATCSYVGPAPVPLTDYVVAAEAQTIRAESPKRRQLEAAFNDVSVNREIFETLGPAVNSGAGLFLYGEPGNGKTTLAKRIIRCFGQQVWVPYTIIDDGQIIKFFDPSLHHVPEENSSSLDSTSYDERWVRIQRPTVVVGGELTLDSLEIRHDPNSNVSEAPLQLKANCGCFLIDDFGRQRVDPAELLNRWIVPLENRIDFLTLSTGKKIQVPFEQLIVFSTNLDPSDLVDEAFLRRIPYKIFVRDPERKEFHALFRHYARKAGCEYHPEVIDRLITKHYLMANRQMRRCHPRDLIGQIRNYCAYNDIRMEMRDEYFDVVVRSYFADAITEQPGPASGEMAKMPAETAPAVPTAASAMGSQSLKTQAHAANSAATMVKGDVDLHPNNATMMIKKHEITKAAKDAPPLVSKTLSCDPTALGQAVHGDLDAENARNLPKVDDTTESQVAADTTRQPKAATEQPKPTPKAVASTVSNEAPEEPKDSPASVSRTIDNLLKDMTATVKKPASNEAATSTEEATQAGPSAHPASPDNSGTKSSPRTELDFRQLNY